MLKHKTATVVFALFLQFFLTLAEPPSITLPFDPYQLFPTTIDTLEILSPQEKLRRIEILNANRFEQFSDTTTNILIRKLVGNVRLRHKSTLMNSDSALLYVQTNYVEAGGNIFIKNGDTMTIRGQKLKYFGDQQYAIIEENVVLKDGKTMLTTNTLDYQLNTDIGTFTNQGKVTKDSITITSNQGIYDKNKQEIFFKYNVELKTKEYNIFADSMRYDLEKDIAYFIGKTLIVGEEDTIHTTKGYFDNKTNKIYFEGRPLIKRSNTTITANSIDINNKSKNGIAKGDVHFVHKEEHFEVIANQIEYKDSIGYTMASKDPLLIQIDTSKNDTLYLSADTIISYYTYFVKDTIINIKDSARIMQAYHHSKVFQKNLSAICDSIYADYKDSLMVLNGSPLAWIDSTQVSADTIILKLKNKQVDKIMLRSNSWIIQMNADSIFNQIKGKNIDIYIEDEKIKYTYIDGNAESIYFLQNDKKEYMGANQSKSAYIEMYFDKDEITKIKLAQSAEAVFTPMKKIDLDNFLLEDFIWHWDLKPKSKNDVIRNTTLYNKIYIEH
jgi:lipopolysaccharide export system protein LptA